MSKRQKLEDGGKKKRRSSSAVPYWQLRAATQARRNITDIFPKGSERSVKFWGPDYKEAIDLQKNLRKALRYKGKGDYRETLSKFIPKGTFAKVGGYLGRLSQIPGLDEVGHYAGGKLANYVGFGDYEQPAMGNQLMGGSVMGNTAHSSIMVNPMDDSGDIWYSHSEFVQNVTASASGAGQSAFQLTKFPLNPGLAATFPFLSQLAQCFEIYEFHGLVFQYKPTSGESGATNNSLGKVIMATNYDPTAADFVNAVQMENYDYASSVKPSVGMIHGVETDMSKNITNAQFIRTGASSKQLPFTDLGNLYVATEGVPFAASGTQILGELWVSYKVRLSRANLYGSLLGYNIPFHYAHGSNLSISSQANQTLGGTVSVAVNGGGYWELTYTFPSNISLGQFQWGLAVKTASASSTAIGTPTYTNATAGTGTPYYSSQVLAASGQALNGYGNFNVVAPGSSIAILKIPLGNTGGGSAGNWCFQLTQISIANTAWPSL